MTPEKNDLEALFHPGLEGVPVCRSSIAFIDGNVGILEYRGIRIEDLAVNSTFEETAYLLLKGHLPSPKELSDFDWELRRHRRLRPEMLALLRTMPRNAHPMAMLQTATAALGLLPEDHSMADAAGRWHTVCKLIAKIPTAIAAFHRIRQGLEPVPPNDDLSHASSFIHMLTGNVPSEREARYIEVCLILHAEHTLNASTFTGRVVGSTMANPYCVLAAAIGALTGPLHGGANEAVVGMLEEIGSLDKVRPWMEKKISAKEKIMGLGHRVYKTKDPRAIVLQKIARELFAQEGTDPLLSIAEEVERVAVELLAPKGIYPNVDFYSGLVYRRLGIPEDLATPLFAASRSAGWLAHWLEQLDGNKIFRPTQIYTAGHAVPYVSIDRRP